MGTAVPRLGLHYLVSCSCQNFQLTFRFSLILLFNGFASFMPKWNASDFFASYVTIPLVLLSFIIWKLVKKTKFVPLDEMDLSGGPREAMIGTRYDTGGPMSTHITA